MFLRQRIVKHALLTGRVSMSRVIIHPFTAISPSTVRLLSTGTGSSFSNDHSQLPQEIELYFTKTKEKYQALNDQLMGDIDSSKMAQAAKDLSDMSKTVELIEQREQLLQAIADLNDMVQEEENKGSGEGNDLAAMAREEAEELLQELRVIEPSIVKNIMPRDSADSLNIVLEVRAGTGGEEASLFASELFRMYEVFCKGRGWRWELLTQSRTDIGGFTAAQANVSGENVYEQMKFESGVHRVQRVPVNDSKIQTSAASVVIMPEPTEVEVNIRPQDLKIDLYRSQGAGGQSVNTTDSAVRITHIPTGIIVAIQDERSQIQNKKKALKILGIRVFDHERQKVLAARSELRSKAGGTGDRSHKIRTYNFPQDRITDHRIGLTVPGVHRVLSGEELGHILENLQESDANERLQNFVSQAQSPSAN